MTNKNYNIIFSLRKFIELIGFFSAILIFLMMVLTFSEVILRNILNKPTTWTFIINQFLLLGISALGGGYALLYDSHVRADFIYSKFNIRKKAYINIITSLLFFLFVGVMLFQTTKAALWSISIKERSPTIFPIPIYPIKMIVSLGFFIILIGGIIKFIENIIILKK